MKWTGDLAQLYNYGVIASSGSSNENDLNGVGVNMEIKNVCVVGAGMMGRQIGLNTAKYGYQVAVIDNNEAVCQSMEAWMDTYLAGRIQKKRMTEEEVDGIRSRILITTDLEKAVRNADLVIEAIIEDETAKHEMFKAISRLAKDEAILVSNSSTFVSSSFTEDVRDPSKLANLHYFNPALVMELVEIARNASTSDDTVDSLVAFAKATGKTPVILQKEIEKFITNRIITAINNEAFWLVENGYCTYQDVDIACEKGAGQKMGPFRMKDLTGIDRNFLMMKAEFEKTGVKPNGYDLFRKMYEEGRYGQKNGHGFYDYE